MGASISNVDFCMIVLSSLPTSWDTVVATLYDTKSLAKVITRVTMHGDRLTRNKASKHSAQAQQTSVPRPTVQCSNPNCKQRGHTVDNCFWPGGSEEGQFPVWWNCKGRGGDREGGQQAADAITTSANTMMASPSESYFLMATT